MLVENMCFQRWKLSLMSNPTTILNVHGAKTNVLKITSELNSVSSTQTGNVIKNTRSMSCTQCACCCCCFLTIAISRC